MPQLAVRQPQIGIVTFELLGFAFALKILPDIASKSASLKVERRLSSGEQDGLNMVEHINERWLEVLIFGQVAGLPDAARAEPRKTRPPLGQMVTLVLLQSLKKALLSATGMTDVHNPKRVVVQHINSSLLSEVSRGLPLCVLEIALKRAPIAALSPFDTIPMPKQAVVSDQHHAPLPSQRLRCEALTVKLRRHRRRPRAGEVLKPRSHKVLSPLVLRSKLGK